MYMCDKDTTRIVLGSLKISHGALDESPFDNRVLALGLQRYLIV